MTTDLLFGKDDSNAVTTVEGAKKFQFHQFFCESFSCRFFCLWEFQNSTLLLIYILAGSFIVSFVTVFVIKLTSF